MCSLVPTITKLTAADWLPRVPLALFFVFLMVVLDASVFIPVFKRLRRNPITPPSPAPGLAAMLSFKRVSRLMVIVTAQISLILLVWTAMILRYPLYIVTLFVLLPWLPALIIETRWKYQRYGVLAIFALILILQFGHVGEHTAQVTQLAALHGVVACPPPVDTPANAARAEAMGLRPSGIVATNLSATMVVKPAPSGWPDPNAAATPVGCGVFGMLDIEVVHLVWELAGLFATLWLVTRFPHNRWLWLAATLASLHGIEHLFLYTVFLLDRQTVYQGIQQLWATTIDNLVVTAYPAGANPTLVDFYHAGGINGILGAGGMVGTLFGINPLLPARPYLHLFYNAIVLVPTVIAFVCEARRSTAQPRTHSLLAPAVTALTIVLFGVLTMAINGAANAPAPIGGNSAFPNAPSFTDVNGTRK